MGTTDRNFHLTQHQLAESSVLSDYTAGADAIDWCNRSWGGTGSIIGPLFDLIEAKQLKSVTLLDVGCGTGDIDEAIMTEAQERGIGVSLIAMDRDPYVVKVVERRLRKFSGVHTVNADFFESRFSEGTIDIVICSQMIGFLDEDRMVPFLWKAYRLARVGVICADIRRHPMTRLMIRSLNKRLAGLHERVKQSISFDIQRSLKLKAIRKVLSEAGLPYMAYTLAGRPYRMILTAEKLDSELKRP